MKKYLYVLFVLAAVNTLEVFSQDFEVISSHLYTNLTPAAIGQNYEIVVGAYYNLDVELPTNEYPGMSIEYLYEWHVDGRDVTSGYENMPSIVLSSAASEPLYEIDEHEVEAYIIGVFKSTNDLGENVVIRRKRIYLGLTVVTTYRFDNFRRMHNLAACFDRRQDHISTFPYSYAITEGYCEVRTDPNGYGFLFDCYASSGIITKADSNVNSFLYTSPIEYKLQYNVQPFEIVDVHSVNSRNTRYEEGHAYTTTHNISLYSVFQCMVNNNMNEYAWRHSVWKYNIDTTGANSICYDPRSKPEAAYTNAFNNVSLYDGAFTDEWTCASTVGHEIVHCNQGLAYRALPKSPERDAYKWELDHSDAPLCGALPVTYIYSQSRGSYDFAKTKYIDNGGTLTYP